MFIEAFHRTNGEIFETTSMDEDILSQIKVNDVVSLDINDRIFRIRWDITWNEALLNHRDHKEKQGECHSSFL
jgi:hypothetical protein